MNKRILSLCLALVLLLCLLPQAVLPASAEILSGKCGDNLTWTLDTETGVLSIQGNGAMEDYYLDSPWMDYSFKKLVIKDGVTSIGNYAFYYCHDLVSVVIPNSVTTIGQGAFAFCSSLTNVTIPASVTKIGDAFLYSFSTPAFKSCSSLKQITVDKNNPKYCDENGVLYDKDKTSLVQCPGGLSGDFSIPQSVEWVGLYSFENCDRLTSVTIPEGVSFIGPSAFSECYNLRRISVSQANEYYCDENGVLFDKEKKQLLQCPGNYTGSYEIPKSVTDIEPYAFSGCHSLTSVTIPDGITEISYRMFEDCASLESVSMPDSITNIESDAFNNCTNLKNIIIPENVTQISECAFSNCSSLASIIIPDSVTAIGWAIFENCTSLTSVTISSGMTYISGGMFQGCTSLKKMEIPANIQSIQEKAFLGCTSLSSVGLPDGLEYVSDYAFLNCTTLSKIIIPRSVSSIGYQAFGYYNPDIYYIYSDNSIQLDGFTVYGFRNSAAQNYARENKFKFVALDATDENPFTDLDENDYYYDAVLWAYNHDPQITAGTNKTHFSPYKTCTREQVVTFLWRAKGCPEPSSTNNPFKDVPADAYYTKAVLWAVENGISNGKSKTKFGVGDPCTRGQVVTFLWRAEGEPEPTSATNPFKDVSETDYFYKAVLWAVENGITNGTSKTKFSPANTCTRGQVVTFLYRDVVGEQ